MVLEGTPDTPAITARGQLVTPWPPGAKGRWMGQMEKGRRPRFGIDGGKGCEHLGRRDRGRWARDFTGTLSLEGVSKVIKDIVLLCPPPTMPFVSLSS